jgi:lipopolysaccharide assembly protein A
MRIVCFLILLIVLATVAVFAVQNNETVTLHYLDRSVSSSLPLLIAIVYLLGMVSGWTVVGFLSRSLRRVTKRREDPGGPS